MQKEIKLKKGLNIKLVGDAEKVIAAIPVPETYAIKPVEFLGVTPKLLVKNGDEVQAGTPLFYDKKNEALKFCAPVSGEIIDVVRGAKRKILEIRILADKEINFLQFEAKDPAALNREAIKELLLKSGCWPCIRQRPYGIIADLQQAPKSIFISSFDSGPLAPDYNFIMQGQEKDFQTGIDALKQLTDGPVHLNIKKDNEGPSFFSQVKGVQVNIFSGPHPVGNVGVQIHHLDPVNKGEVVWCIHPQDVLVIGRLFNQGIYDTSRIIAVTGSGVQAPKYFRTMAGGALVHMLEEAGIKQDDQRVISGNVLTGTRIEKEGYLNFYDHQVTVIPEGHEPEFMGWLAPGLNKYSASRAYFSWLNPGKKHVINTNLHGEERPFVVSGEYEKVFPMDIYPVHLLKAILVEDIELMENLGIYEVVEEDFALCEFICTSKIQSQQIIRRGLDMVRKEFS